MKVRILSGNQAGAIEDMDQQAAEHAIATGYGEAYVEPEPEKKGAKSKAVEPDPIKTTIAPAKHR